MNKITLTDETKTELQELFEKLNKINVTKIVAEFSGSGDSGEINSIKYNDGELDVEVGGVDKAIDTILEEYGWDWYNNEGGYGSVTLLPKTGKIEVDMNINQSSSTSHPGSCEL